MELFKLINALPGALAQGLIWGIMAIGVYITYKILDIADLTVDGTLCTGGAVCVVAIMHGLNPYLALLLALLAGALAGLVTGLLHTLMGIPAILAGILTQLALWSINLVAILGKANQAISVDKYQLLVSLRWVKDVPFQQNTIFVVACFVAVIIGLLYWFFGTELGSALRATGANAQMARAQGINTDRNKVIGLMISNGLVALAGALLSQFQGFADINMGRGAIVIGLAAVIIGEVLVGWICRNFAFQLFSVAVGSVVYYLVIQVVLWAGLDSNYLKMLSAMVVAVFLAVPHWKKRLHKTRVKGDGTHA